MAKVSRRTRDVQKVRYYEDKPVERCLYIDNGKKKFRWYVGERPNGKYVEAKDTVLR